MATKKKAPQGLAAQRAAKKTSDKAIKALGPWTPYTPDTTPPAGTYDPGLDSQLSASGRGLEDLGQDIQKADTRRTDDYQRGIADISRQRFEGTADFATSRQRTGEDYQQSLAGLRRQYDRLGNTQRQQQAAAGVEGGVLAQSQRKRLENQQFDQQPIDTAKRRFDEDTTTHEQRFNEGLDRATGDMSLGYTRAGEDSASTLSRAQREGGFFGQDIGAAKWFQAKQTGYQAPVKPKGEYGTGADAYRFVRLPDGRLVKSFASGKTEVRSAKAKSGKDKRKG